MISILIFCICAHVCVSGRPKLLPPASEGWQNVMFSLCPPFQGVGGLPDPRSGQGGYPIPGLDRGVPHPRFRWGYPILLMGGTPIQDQDWMGYPHPRLDRVPPVQDWMGYPRPRLDWVPPSKTGWGIPIQDWTGYPPPHPGLYGVPPIQGWMLRGGRCASCVHAGGLSCLDLKSSILF